jgi:hypothetical protein
MRRTTRINFSKTALAALAAPTAGRVAYCDTRTRGLLVLITLGGIKPFCVRRKLNGQSERICIGRFPEWSVEEARACADEINAAYGRGENPADLSRAKRSEMTLDDPFEQYMARNGPHLRRPDKPRNNYRLYLGHWCNRRLSTIKHHEVDRLHNGDEHGFSKLYQESAPSCGKQFRCRRVGRHENGCEGPRTAQPSHPRSLAFN